jgi:hypothetical protein
MNYTFTIDEDIIRRLALRQEQDERQHTSTRFPSLRSWRGVAPVRKQRASLAARTRWS